MHISSTGPALPTHIPSAEKARAVPPGLADRGGLPPGMQKKLDAGEAMPPGILRRFPAATPAPTPPTTDATSAGTTPTDGSTAPTTTSVDLLA
jgi:hypothetical protein